MSPSALSRVLAFLSFGAVALALRAQEPATRTAAPVPPYTDLFNRHNLDGWSYFNLKGVPLGAVAQVTPEGILHVTGKPLGYLLAPGGNHANFRLHVEYRWVAPKGNSGIFVFVTSGPRFGKPWPTCLQIQNRDQHTGELIPMAGFTFKDGPPDGKILPLRHPPRERPIGQWNTCDIICDGGTVAVNVNGVEQNRCSHCSAQSGGIALQLEGHPFEIRVLRLAPLQDAAMPLEPTR